jgi:cell division septum initiation protein DivIVA
MFSVSAVTDRTFTTTRLREGYEIAEVEEYRTDVEGLFTALDQAIDELNADLAAARARLAEAEADRGHRVQTRAEPAAAAGRLLETAALTADQLVADAKAEAESLLSAARAEAADLLTTSRAEAECVTAEAARQVEQQAAEVEEYRSRVLTDVAGTKARLEAQIEVLRQLEREQRNHLRGYFAECLAQLDEAAAPAALRAVSE